MVIGLCRRRRHSPITIIVTPDVSLQYLAHQPRKVL